MFSTNFGEASISRLLLLVVLPEKLLFVEVERTETLFKPSKVVKEEVATVFDVFIDVDFDVAEVAVCNEPPCRWGKRAGSSVGDNG